MNQAQQRRLISAIAALAIISALLLLLFPHATGFHATPLLWLALCPVLLFGILEIQSSQRLPVQANRQTALLQPVPLARFQRPPPSA